MRWRWFNCKYCCSPFSQSLINLPCCFFKESWDRKKKNVCTLLVSFEVPLEINSMFFCWQDLKSSNQRDEIAAARASLKENSSLLHSICSACLEHSDVASLTASKDSICNEIQNALNVISNASQGAGNKMGQPTSHTATLGSALDELEVCKPVRLQHFWKNWVFLVFFFYINYCYLEWWT